MATQHDTTRTFVANAEMSQFIRVTLSTNGGVGPAGTANPGIGILQNDTVTNDTYGAVVRMPGAGSFKIAVTGAVTTGDLLYPAAAGYASATGTVALGLRAAESAAGTNAVIEAIPTFAVT